VLLAALIVAGFLWLRPAFSAGLRRLAVPLAMLVAYALMIGLAVGGGRGVNSSRYLFLGGLLVLMIVVLAFPRRPLRRVELTLVGVACALSLSVNVIQYHQAAGELRTLGGWNRAALAALRDFEPDGGYPEPAASLDGSVGPSPDDVSNNLTFSAPEYLSAIARFGDPADSAAQLRHATAGELAAADRMLMRANGFYLYPTSEKLRGRCRVLDGAPEAPATQTLPVPAGETILAGTGAGGPGFHAWIRGIGRTFDAAATVPGGFRARLTGPAGPVRWRVRFAFLQPGRVCLAPAPGRGRRRPTSRY
jgi:hypothetical protein